MVDIAQINNVAVANIAGVAGRTTAAGDSVMNVLFPGVAAGIIESIQQIEFTVASSSATGTDTITSVDTANTAIFFSYNIFGGKRQTDTTNSVDDTHLRVELTNATTVTATRNSAPAFAITVICTVVEFTSASIDSIQQGSIAITGANTSNTDTISSVTTSRSVVLHNGQSSTDSGVAFGRSICDLALTNATTVTATRVPTDVLTTTTNYVVIEFAAGIVDSVQEFNITITNSLNTTNTATITSVDTSRSFIFPGGITTNDSGGVGLDASICYAELTNGTTVTATRNTAGSEQPGIAGTVVEFSSGRINSIQRGVATIAGASLTEDVTVTSVTTSLSMVNALSSTSTSGSSIDNEEQTFTIEIVNATTIRATRNVTGRDVIFSWELVEFAA